MAKKARIKVRIGTSHRAYHMVTCSHTVNFTRKRSDLHEAQLNFQLLKPFDIKQVPSEKEVLELIKGYKAPVEKLPNGLADLQGYYILHPKSQGSALEWPLANYIELAKEINQNGAKVLFTGTEDEGKLFRSKVPWSKDIIDTTGKLSLSQLITLISNANGLIACSTGPLHIAGYLGVKTIGLYSPKRPIHPGRWSPLGTAVSTIVFDENCPKCSEGKDCNCIERIGVDRVLNEL